MPSENEIAELLKECDNLLVQHHEASYWDHEHAKKHDFICPICVSKNGVGIFSRIRAARLALAHRPLLPPRPRDEAEAEKATRIKYQDIAYKAMDFIDRINGDKASRGTGCNVENFSEKLHAATKAIQELHQDAGMRGIASQDAIAAGAQVVCEPQAYKELSDLLSELHNVGKSPAYRMKMRERIEEWFWNNDDAILAALKRRSGQ